MNRYRYFCPFVCGWFHDEPDIPPNRIVALIVESGVRAVAVRRAGAVEAALKAHLDESHTGWTLESVSEAADAERERQELRAVFGIMDSVT